MCVCESESETGDKLRSHSLHAEPVLYKEDVMEVHWDLSLPAGVVAEEKITSERGRKKT